jgi:hypothetical protein
MGDGGLSVVGPYAPCRPHELRGRTVTAITDANRLGERSRVPDQGSTNVNRISAGLREVID